ncbi:MAG TPA: ASCH domain-containing protein [Treponema sp.]|nr:ASCH domain-containing protein [Treponema sp.]
MSKADVYWYRFLEATGRDREEKCAGDMTFEAHGFVGDELLSLVLTGKKTALFTSYATYAEDNEPLPATGELYVVLDRAETPRCIIETTGVTIVPFDEVTWEMAQLEGEDENLEAWRGKHKEYLEDEGAVVGFDFSPGIKLVFQTFRVVYSGIL